jgi:hypothetical protein
MPRSSESPVEGEAMSRPHTKPLWLLLFGLSVSFALSSASGLNAQETDGDSAKAGDNGAVVQYPDTKENEEVPGNNAIEARPVSPARKEALKRRAGEKVAGEPRGRAVVLGMHIQEVDNERAKVVEVAPASAAFDAGIRKGDEIVSFDGFKATTYREWIDGMQKLATDAPDGDTLPIVLVRDSKRLNLRIRMPIAKAGTLPLTDDIALTQTIVPGQPGQPGAIVPGQQPLPYGGGGGDDILIANAFGDDFGSVEGGSTERAIAEIFRLNTPEQPPEPNAGEVSRQGAAQPNATNQRARDQTLRASPDVPPGVPGANIGLAGFRNDVNGMFVMVDVGSLPPGNYIVGIDDPSVLGTDVNPNATLPDEVPRNPRGNAGPAGTTNPNVPPASSQPVVPRQGGGAVSRPAGAAPAGQPVQQPAGDVNPQGRLQPPVNRQSEIQRSVLAQVADSQGGTDIPATGQTRALDTPPTGNVEPLDTPPTGQVKPSGATATGLPRVGDPRDDPNIVNDPGAGGGIGPALRIGTLTVDQSGTGRMQQVVESVRVQDVVGQAIAIYSQNGVPQTTLPPALDATADPLAGRQQAAGQQQPESAARAGATQSTETSSGAATAEPGPTNGVNDTPAAANNAVNGLDANGPIAGGLIRLMSERLPGEAGASPTGQGLPNPQTPVDAQLAPQNGVPQNSVAPPNPVQP